MLPTVSSAAWRHPLDVPHLHGDRRHRAPCSRPATCCWMLQRVAFGTLKPEFENAHIHDVHVPEWIAWTPLLLLIVVLGIYPNLLFSVTDGAVGNVGKRRRWRLAREPVHRLPRVRAGDHPHGDDRHRPARRPLLPSRTDLVPRARVRRRARRADPGDHARRRRCEPRRCSTARTSSTTTRWRSRAFFLIVAYVSLLVSVDYISDGDYYQGEYYFLLLTSVLGMLVMASARDLISIFVALETITIPTFVLAGWRKHDTKSNEAALKYFLIGVLSTAVMLYGMSMIYGIAGLDAALRHLRYVARRRHPPLFAVGDLPHARRLRVQGERGAVPLLDARHLRGRAHAGHRVPLGRVEGRRVRRAAHDHQVRVLRRRATRGSRCSGSSRRRR